MAEVAREGSGVTWQDDMELDEDDAPEPEDRVSDDNEDDEGPSTNGKRKNGKIKARRKRWRERFKLVGIDGR
jgi:hypothetical protein